MVFAEDMDDFMRLLALGAVPVLESGAGLEDGDGGASKEIPAPPPPRPGGPPEEGEGPVAGSGPPSGGQAEASDEPGTGAGPPPTEWPDEGGGPAAPGPPPQEEGPEAGPGSGGEEAAGAETAEEGPPEPPADGAPPCGELSGAVGGPAVSDGGPEPAGSDEDGGAGQMASRPQLIVLLVDPSVLGRPAADQEMPAQPPAPSEEPGQRRGEGLVLGAALAPCSIGICDFYNGRAIPGAGSLVLSKCGVSLDAELGFRLFRRVAVFLDIGAMAVVKRLTVLPGAAAVGHLVVEGGADALFPFKEAWELGAGLSGGIMLGFNAGRTSASPSLGVRLAFARRLNSRLAARLAARARVALNGSSDPLRRSATWLVDPLVLSLAFDL